MEVYNLSMEIAENVWKDVIKWNYFERDSMGKQLVRAVDSIGANIAEGFGRFHFQENKHFCYYARGSLFETKVWLQKALTRKLITEEVFTELNNKIKLLHVKLNAYIKSIGKDYTNSK